MWMFIGIVSFLAWIVFGIMWVVSLIKKNGKAKRNIIVSVVCFVLFVAAVSFDTEDTDTATTKDAVENVKLETIADKAVEEVEKVETAEEKAKREEDAKLKAEAEAKQKIEDDAKAAEDARIKAEEDAVIARGEELKKSMRVVIDDIEGTTFYTDSTTTEYNNVNSFHAYIATAEGYKPTLRLVIQYTGDDWLFIDKYTVNVDGFNYTINADGMVKRDNNSGVWEWYDYAISPMDLEMLDSIIAAEKVTVRHSGDTYHKDRVLTDKEKQALKRVVQLYDALNLNAE